jgi:transposase-like protein
MNKKPNLNFKSIISFLLEIFPTEQACVDYFEEKRWKGKPISPFDPVSKVYKCANNRYRCKNTGKYFSVRTGTVFENSNLPLQKWFLAFYLLSSNKKGISSRQLVKYISITQKSAWFVLHRLRCAFKHPSFKAVLKGFVEIDETFIGGKNKNRHWNKKVPNSQGRSWKDKTPVLGMIERGGNLVCQVISNTQQNTLKKIINANIKRGSNVYTDEWYLHSNLSENYSHQWINHNAKQYVNNRTTTNSIENVWSHLKRMIYGIYHQVSKKHLSKYVNEFTLRFNTRKWGEQERFDLVLASSIGMRLTYRELIN